MEKTILKALATAAVGFLAASLFLLPAAGGSPAFHGAKQNSPKKSSSSSQAKPATIVYVNSRFGFRFTLPSSWKGFKVEESEWTGAFIDEPEAGKQPPAPQKGPILSIVSPLSTPEIPRQSIPIMVFRIDQWALIEQEKISVSGAPMPPTELGRNAKFVFALPPRYNFNDESSSEEIAKIIASKPLHAF